MEKSNIDAMLEAIPNKNFSGRKVFGVGVNDSSFQTSFYNGGLPVKHRAYSSWSNLLQSCYSPKFLEKHPALSGYSVCDEWLYFSNFFKWWKDNYVEGWEIDKDMLVTGNKIYSPETCVYIPESLNKFINLKSGLSSKYPIGAHASGKKFQAEIRNELGVRTRIGRFDTAEEAHSAWLERKLLMAIEHKPLCDSIHPGLYDGMVSYIKKVARDSINEFKGNQ